MASAFPLHFNVQLTVVSDLLAFSVELNDFKYFLLWRAFELQPTWSEVQTKISLTVNPCSDNYIDDIGGINKTNETQ